MSQWIAFGKMGGRPRTRPTIVKNGVEMSVKHEQRRKYIYAYGIWTDEHGKQRKTYLGKVAQRYE